MIERDARIQINKPGGTAGKGSKTYRITLPNTWIQQIGITEEDRAVTLKLTEDNKILIEKK